MGIPFDLNSIVSFAQMSAGQSAGARAPAKLYQP